VRHPRDRLYRVTLGDYLVAAGIVLASFLAGVRVAGKPVDAPRRALLYQDGRLERVLELAHDGQVRHRLNGDELVLEVDRGRVRVLQTSCPRKVCRRQGWISSPNQSIVCAPERILVTIEDPRGARSWDVLSY